MHVLSIAYYTAIKYFRVIWLAPALIITVIVATYTMGMFFDSTGSKTEDREKVGFYAPHEDTVSSQLEKLLHTDEANKIIELVTVASREEGIRKMENAQIDVLIYLKGNQKSDEKSVITIYYTGNRPSSSMMLESFINSINGYGAIAKAGLTSVTVNDTGNLFNTDISTEGKVPDSKNSMSIVCILLVIFYGALLGSNLFLQDLKKNTFIRARSTPIRSIEDFTGKLLGNITVMFVCTLVSTVILKFAFGLTLGGNIGVLLLALLLFLIIANSIGVLLARIFKNIYLSGIVTFALNFTLVYSIMANSFAPGTSTSFDALKMISPHYYTYQAVIGNTFPGAADVTGSLISLAVIALLLTVIAWRAVRRVWK